jgi:hypothetical protein
MIRLLYLGHPPSTYHWEEDTSLNGGGYRTKHQVLRNGAIFMLIDPQSKEVRCLERDVEVRMNEYYWLLIRKKGFSLDYQWVVKLW